MQELIEKAQQLFNDIPRPAHFTNYVHCCECAEHDESLQAHSPETIGYDELGNPAWDPICFATEDAFLYYFPALVRLALKGSEDAYYFDQFLSHVILDGPRNRRWLSFSAEQRQLVAEVLRYMLEHRTEDVDKNCDADRLLEAISIWADNGN